MLTARMTCRLNYAISKSVSVLLGRRTGAGIISGMAGGVTSRSYTKPSSKLTYSKFIIRKHSQPVINKPCSYIITMSITKIRVSVCKLDGELCLEVMQEKYEG